VHTFAVSGSYVVGPSLIMSLIVGRSDIANGWFFMMAATYGYRRSH
jgi:hypothetical protein